VQLDKMLSSEDAPATFSAATLSKRFDHPPRADRTTSIGKISKALWAAFAGGKIVAYYDGGNLPLREPEKLTHGSKAVGQPQIYGLLGSPSPDPNYHPVTYQETLHGGGTAHGGGDDRPVAAEAATVNGHSDGAGPALNGDGVDVPAAAAPGPGEPPAEAMSEPGEPPAEDAPEPLSEDEAFERALAYPQPGTVAPEWLPDRVLREWVAMPEVCAHVVRGLDTARGPAKFELIRAGVTRKQRSWRPESTVAGNLAKLTRSSETVWGNVARIALKRHYLADGAFTPAGLVRIAVDPDGVYDDGDCPPAGVLLCAMALDVDETTLRLIADDCATVLGQLTVLDHATAQQERIDALEAEAKELRRTAKDANNALRASGKREQSLSDEIERLRRASEQAGTAADEELRRSEREQRDRAEQAEAQLEELRADAERADELEARLQGLEDAEERLEQAEAQLRDERRLRVQAERDAERHIARVRELTDQLTRVADSRNLPVDNPEALVETLARPIGQAARHASERLVAGRARPHDNLMLELAATLVQMTRRLDADVAAIAAEDAADAAADAAEAEALAEAVEAYEAPVEPAIDEPVATPAAEPQPDAALAAPAEPAARARRRRSRIKVRPLGGAGEVGGSAILVTNTSGHTVLLDCGQRVRGEYGIDTEPVFHRRIGQEGRLHAILLSHAHIDHVGSLPVLHREQSDAQHEPIPVYMTQPTRGLAEIMLADSAKIQHFRETDRAEVGFLDYGADAMQEAAYGAADVRRVLDDEFVREVALARAQPIPGTSFVARFLPVAHVLGSCAIHLTDTENDQTLLYTGDLGPIGDPQVTLPQYALGEMLGADVVIMESTYGVPTRDVEEGRHSRRALSGRERAIKRLSQEAQRCYEAGGAMLLPAFSLGRTQELAMLIHQARQDGDCPNGEIVVAGMGERITQVYESYSRGANPWARAENMPRVDELGGRLRSAPDLRFEDVADEVLGEGFAYVIASPAMLGNGWSRTFLERMVDNPANAIMLTGFIPRNAGKIPRLHQLRRGEVIELGSRRPRIQAEFLRLQGLSAHAPSGDLRKFAEYMSRQGDHVSFGMVHGEEAAQNALASDVTELPNATAQPLQNGQVWNPSRT
jgi:Cft2 family RNA processing exonuclease